MERFFNYAKKITIGSNTRIGAYTTIRDHIHKNVSSKNQVIKSKSKIQDIIIGNDVWIGNYCTIFPGVKIGNNSIVVFNSYRAIPANVQVAGQPARIIKKL